MTIKSNERLTMELSEIFTKELIEHYRDNKTEITSELLETLRSYGNEGKKLALEILDTPIDQEKYHLDAFGNRMSFNGNRMLRKGHSKIGLYPIHIEEITRCKDDIFYFMDNYVKITTKAGINFPELRDYQRGFIETLSGPSESILGLMGRQSGKSISTSIYLSHLYCFESEKNIGIVANKGAMAREFLSNVKNIIMGIPIWLQPGAEAWNKSYIEAENKMRILTDVPTANAFRGYSIHVAIIDECAFIPTNVWNEFIDAFLPSQAALSWKKNVILSTPKGMNHFHTLVKDSSPDYETDGSGVKQPDERSNGYTLFKVDWKDVPRFDSDNNIIPPEEFQDKIVRKHGELYWQQNFQCISGDSIINIYDRYTNEYRKVTCEELKKLIN